MNIPIFKSLLTFIILIFFLTTNCIAEDENEFTISLISSNDGLPTEEIRKIFKDDVGFMWFATPEGLMRYDGYEIKIYSTTNYLSKGLITNSIMDITQDNEGNLWLATDHGVAKFEMVSEKFTFFNTTDKCWGSKSYDLINSLAIDSEGDLWIGTGGHGIFRLNTHTNEFLQFNKMSKKLNMTSEWVTRILCDSKNNVWVCTWEGDLILINTNKEIYKSWVNISNEISFATYSPFSLHEAENNTYWLGLWGKGIVQLNLDEQNNIHLKKKFKGAINSMIIYDIDIDLSNNLWLGTPNGVVRVLNPESDSVKYFFLNALTQTEKKIPQYEAFTVLCNPDGLIWAGTMTGVSILDPYSKIFNTYKIPIVSSTLLSQAVTAFSTDSQGRLLVGVRGHGFGSYNLKTNEFKSFKSIEPYRKLNSKLNTINCFYWDKDGYLWLGTRYLGLIKLDPKTGEYIEINKTQKKYNFTAKSVQDIIQDHIGNIWVGTEKGVYKIIPYHPISLDDFSIIKYTTSSRNKSSVSSDQISKILEDSNHNLWICTLDNGLNLLVSGIETHVPAKFIHYNHKSEELYGITSDQTFTIFEDSKQTLWVGTAGSGLFKKSLQSEKFVQVNEIENFIGNSIFSICEDNDHCLWFTSDQGLIKMDLKNSPPSYTSFSQSNGLQNNNFIKSAVYKNKKGQLFFGGNKGFNCFYPQEVKANASIPPVAISNIKIGNHNYPVPQSNVPIEMEHKNNSISITLSALSYSSPQNNKYATKLENVDENWRYLNASMRTVTYANLSPGKYILNYKASNSNGLWNTTTKKIQIIVHPAYYETWWAISLYVIIIAFTLFYIIYKERITHRISKSLEIEHIKHEKSANMLKFKKRLFASISNEFITPLNILYVYVENWKHTKAIPAEQDLLLAQRNINRLIRFNKQFLYYSTAEFNNITLSISCNNLNSFINEVCDNFDFLMSKKEIHFIKDIQINSNKLWFDLEKLDIILYNLLALSLKWTPYKESITIQAYTKQSDEINYAHFKITHKFIPSDTSLDEWDKMPEEDSIENFGIGLAITKQMIELHKGNLSIIKNQPIERILSFNIPVTRNAYPDSASLIGKSSTEKNIDFLKNKIVIEEDTLTSLKNITNNSESKSTILIIEPDSDLRKVIKSQLSPFFNVKEASSGQAGLKYALNHPTNLIISDSLTTHFTGIDICKEIKKTPNKDHIPIIILSGQPSENERALYYKAGANSYISKPFDINTLFIRIQNLIEQKALLSSSNSLKNKSLSLPLQQLSKNDKFLHDLKDIVEKNLSNPNFGVSALVDELKISNSMLYRRLTETVNLNPNSFIKKMRLIRATELLENTDQTISEISYNCGFSDISYFGYSFKKNYGISPSVYRRNFNKQESM